MKQSIPKGTRDFGPNEMAQRTFVFEQIKSVFKNFGFLPLETPSFEYLSTLTGKYGDEGDQLIFKILNSGDYLSEADDQLLADKNSKKLTPSIAEKALRYDLTVPFARYVVMHQNEISFPFKRYQIQPVWRADRPQKGRYREFYQCDADIIGSTSLLNEVELIDLIANVFLKLNLPVKILINNRKILAGIADVLELSDKFIEFTVVLDKIDKVGIAKVKEDLIALGVNQTALIAFEPLMQLSGSLSQKLTAIGNFLNGNQTGLLGIQEIETMMSQVDLSTENNSEVDLDITLARGLNYYTGAIFEVKANHPNCTLNSSICGGGRYDDLTGVFGLKNLSGVGISFGADRIVDVLLELDLFPIQVMTSTKVMIVNFGEEQIGYSIQVLRNLRSKGISTMLYPDTAKMKKQMSYANDRNIPFVLLLGENEMKENKLTIKNMQSGDQITDDFNQIFDLLK